MGQGSFFFQQVVLEGLGPARGSHVKTQPCLQGKWIFNTVGKIIQWEKDHSFFLTSGARRLGASHVQEKHHASIRHLIRKLTRSMINQGPCRWLSNKEWAWQYRRPGFDPWVRKSPWRRTCQLIAVVLPRESHGEWSLAGAVHGVAETQTWLSMQAPNT